MSRDTVAPSAGADFDLESALDRERAAVEAALERALAGLSPVLPEGYVPVVRHGVLAGGKRIRPILCVAAFRACGGDPEAPIEELAASLELIHAYSLMHDDLPCMDDADLRRGKRTPHRIYGEAKTMAAAAALIPAAALQAWSSATALGLAAEDVRGVVRSLLVAAGAAGMVGGQALDLLGEERTLEPDELDALHARKTGALLALAPTMGGRAAGAEDSVLAGLERYGRELGLAFQIADDVLDATGTARELGKEPSDEELSKATYVSLYGIDEARARAAARADSAQEALRNVGIESLLLHSLADYVVRRRA